VDPTLTISLTSACVVLITAWLGYLKVLRPIEGNAQRIKTIEEALNLAEQHIRLLTNQISSLRERLLEAQAESRECNEHRVRLQEQIVSLLVAQRNTEK
jgi:chromosome segregation ATPase